MIDRQLSHRENKLLSAEKERFQLPQNLPVTLFLYGSYIIKLLCSSLYKIISFHENWVSPLHGEIDLFDTFSDNFSTKCSRISF